MTEAPALFRDADGREVALGPLELALVRAVLGGRVAEESIELNADLLAKYEQSREHLKATADAIAILRKRIA